MTGKVNLAFIFFALISFNTKAQSFEWDTLLDSFKVIDIETTSNGYLYIAGKDWHTYYVPPDSSVILMRSTDNGLIWEPLYSPYNTSDYDKSYAIGIKKDDEDNLYLCYPKYEVLKSVDYGETWNSITEEIDNPAEQDFYDLIYTPNGNLILGTSKRIFISTDKGNVWTSIPDTTLHLRWAHRFFVSPSGEIYGILTNDNILYRSLDDGWNWEKLDVYYCSGMTFLQDGTVLLVKHDFGPSLIKSTDNCETWEAATDYFLSNIYLGIIFTANDNSLFIESRGNDNGIYYSETEGYFWEPVFTYPPSTPNFAKLIHDFAEDSSNYIYAGTERMLFRIAGESLPAEIYSFTAFVNDVNSVILNWTSSAESNNKGFLIQRAESEDKSYSWRDIGFVEGSGTSADTKSYSFEDENLDYEIYFYRLKQIDYDGTSKYGKTIVVDISPIEKFKLSQNYPNPISKGFGMFETTIEYELPKSGKVKLIVYNLLGEKISTLEDRFQQAGKYKTTFNARSLPSGIYFYRLEIGEFSAVKKMAILK